MPSVHPYSALGPWLETLLQIILQLIKVCHLIWPCSDIWWLYLISSKILGNVLGINVQLVLAKIGNTVREKYGTEGAPGNWLSRACSFNHLCDCLQVKATESSRDQGLLGPIVPPFTEDSKDIKEEIRSNHP